MTAGDAEVTRLVSAGFQMSLDGFIAASDGSLGWMRIGPDIIEHATETMRGIDTMLMGRATYIEQAAHWPHRNGELADAVNAHDKVVVTSRPEQLDLTAWHGSRAAHDPAAEIQALRATPGAHIGVTGGARLIRSLLQAELIDEMRVIIHPVALGTGRSPWPEGVRLRLTATRKFDSGAILHIYERTTPRPMEIRQGQ